MDLIRQIEKSGDAIWTGLIAVEKMVIPEQILPSQYYSHSEEFTPEKKLMLAILIDGITCCNRRTVSKHYPSLKVQEALTWVRSEDPTPLFGFERICETLGLASGRLRTHILQAQALGSVTTSHKNHSVRYSQMKIVNKRAR